MTRVLLVDDRQENRYLLARLLQGQGYETAEAQHGAEALALARREAPDLVVSDLLMPVMDGYTLLRHWRSDPVLGSIPFVVYTATYVDDQDRQLAIDLGADAFLMKPAKPGVFLDCVRDVLDRARHGGVRPSTASHEGEELAAAYSEVLIRKLEEKAVALQEANEALQQSERLYRSLFDANPEAMWICDAHTLRFLAVNDAAVAQYGWTAAEFEEMALSDLVHPDDRDRLVDTFASVPLDGLGVPGTWRHRRRDGSSFDVEVRSHSIVFDGRPATVVLALDITDRKLAEQRIRENARLGEMASTLARMGGWDADLASRLVHLSDEVCRIHDVPPETTLTIDEGFDYYAPEWRDRMVDVITRCARQGVPFDEEVEILTARGRRVWVRSVGRAVTGETGAITRVEGAIQDITERRLLDQELARHRDHLEELVDERTSQLAEARQAAEAANLAKSAFLANMSHEIRTPMNGVLGMVDVLARTSLTEQQIELVDTIQESGRALLGIIDDILDFSKIEAGRIDIDPVPLSVSDIVEGVADALLPLARQKNVDVEVFVAPEIPVRVISDEVRLRQMLYNLLGNAIKFSARPDRRGFVRVGVDIVEQHPLRLAFVVADNGVGMTPEVLARLFTPFTQAESSTTRRFGGSGLGLTICKRLADLMRGEIAVTSRPDEGSTFTLTMPFEVPVDQPAREEPDLAGIDCVVVGSPQFDAEAICRYLRYAGARVQSIDGRDTTAREPPAAQVVVLVRDAGMSVPWLTDETSAHVRQVVIGGGRRRRPRIERPGVVGLDAHPVRRETLLLAVALAAGRESSAAPRDPAVERSDVRAVLPSHASILVVEDDEVNRKVILKQLELLGIAADVAVNGVEALSKWREGRFDLVLTDLHMPLMDGYTLAQSIRREETMRGEDGAHRRQPIVALTANAMRGEGDRARASGMDDYITKPLQLEGLRKTLAKWLASVDDAATGAVVPSGIPVLDVSALESIIGSDPHEIREFLTFFLESADRLDREMRDASAAGDAISVGAAAHKLVSSSRSVGALRLAHVAVELERAGTAGGIARVRTLLDAWKTEFSLATGAIGRNVREADGGRAASTTTN